MAIGRGCRPSWHRRSRPCCLGGRWRQTSQGRRPGAGAVSASYLGGADQNRHTLVAAIAAGRHQPVRNDGRQPADRLLPPDRHCEIRARILGHPECRQFGVGRASVAIAKSLGLRTVNVVRRDEVVAEMKALGGNVVLVDGPDLAKRVVAATGNAAIPLALDGVGDPSSMNLMNCLSESGVLVSYGGMSRKPMVVPPGGLIFKKQTIRGFWLLY